MRKGIRAHDVSAQGLENIAARCKMLHYTELQLVLEKSAVGFRPGAFSEEYAQTLKKQTKDVHIAVLGSYINPSASDPAALELGLERFREKLRYAQILKPDVVGTETGFYGLSPADPVNGTEEAYQHLLKNMRGLVTEAESLGVRIGIEGVHCFVINSPEKMSRLMADLDSPCVRVIFDPVNYLTEQNYEQQDAIITETFELLADRLAVLHAKDFVIENGKMKSAAVGTGLLNYGLIFENLRKYGLDIPIITEGADDVTGAMGLQELEKRYT